eukprot:TRINITY_DN10310_c0_g1_i4.p1 TRINITY_DN10310_c0_g1~~TRINITY_DN10310_c0_g1_i4.p1  ORF type:complete len:468 (-),score=55.68 TRINITY_DN10310_c0_g1_i4:682-2085(-)
MTDEFFLTEVRDKNKFLSGFTAILNAKYEQLGDEVESDWFKPNNELNENERLLEEPSTAKEISTLQSLLDGICFDTSAIAPTTHTISLATPLVPTRASGRPIVKLPNYHKVPARYLENLKPPQKGGLEWLDTLGLYDTTPQVPPVVKASRFEEPFLPAVKKSKSGNIVKRNRDLAASWSISSSKATLCQKAKGKMAHREEVYARWIADETDFVLKHTAKLENQDVERQERALAQKIAQERQQATAWFQAAAVYRVTCHLLGIVATARRVRQWEIRKKEALRVLRRKFTPFLSRHLKRVVRERLQKAIAVRTVIRRFRKWLREKTQQRFCHIVRDFLVQFAFSSRFFCAMRLLRQRVRASQAIARRWLAVRKARAQLLQLQFDKAEAILRVERDEVELSDLHHLIELRSYVGKLQSERVHANNETGKYKCISHIASSRIKQAKGRSTRKICAQAQCRAGVINAVRVTT